MRDFADLLWPLDLEGFFADIFDRRHLHLAGRPERTAGLWPLPGFDRLIATPDLWTDRTLTLFLDGRRIPAAEYCQSRPVVNLPPAARPDPARVNALIRQGAALVCNSVDLIHPDLRRLADLLEQGFGGTCEINLYATQDGRTAFPPHFDFHEVVVLQLAGRKKWRVYGRRNDNPLQGLTTVGPQDHAPYCATLVDAPVLTPGDLLYLPRGQYHDATAADGPSVHLACGVTPTSGVELARLLLASAEHDAQLRAWCPPSDAIGRRRFDAASERMGERLAAMARHPELRERLRQLQAHRRQHQGQIEADPLLDLGLLADIRSANS
jgi:ribosomal protein L16 Arg81 hydroxylase